MPLSEGFGDAKHHVSGVSPASVSWPCVYVSLYLVKYTRIQ